ncbi:CorA family divalent cation transporter [Halonatronum saccharophilum]|uniref:CorA family divalent cation transporter n=1 Tax=Halonatronum saccharophilum TaxID=150060 RepID=UPI000486B9DD|nr:CorA family divalent cation transporter [Halonatronum saccharophilum]
MLINQKIDFIGMKNLNATTYLTNTDREYIKFTNRMYFREVTAQEQGIELYDKMRECMRIEREVEALDGEIDELHQYVTVEQESRRNNLLTIITVIGALFTVPNFAMSFFGMNLKNFIHPTNGYEGIFVSNGVIDFMKNIFSTELKSVWQWIAIYFSIPTIITIVGYLGYKGSLGEKIKILTKVIICGIGVFLILFPLITLFI